MAYSLIQIYLVEFMLVDNTEPFTIERRTESSEVIQVRSQ